MPDRRSLRVRITVVATAAVALVLAVASGGLVWVLRSSAIGQIQDAATAAVEAFARDIEAGRSPAPPLDFPGTVVVIRSADGPPTITTPNGDGAAVIPPDAEQIARLPEGDAVVTAVGGDRVVAARQTVQQPSGEMVTVLALSPLAGVASSLATTVRGLLIAAPLLTLFVAALSYLAVDRALRPVERIRARAADISHSNLQQRLPSPQTGDEIERLTGTVNDMLGRLERAWRRQREFVADAAHELRTPLATARAQLEVAQGHPDAADWPMLVHDLLADHRRIQALVDDLLLLASLDEGAARAEPPRPVRLDLVVAAEVDHRSFAVEMIDDLSPATVFGHEAPLGRVVRNLLDNAVAHASTRVRVGVVARDGTVVLSVDDDGLGVPPADRERIFERFARLEASRTRGEGGAGIGLALVQSIVDAHHGTVLATASAWGGARFEVCLPGHPQG